MTENQNNLSTWDYIVVALYFIFVFIIGIWSSRRSRKENVGDYFLASRNMNWLLVGCSLYASNIGSIHFIGLAGSGSSSGIAVAGYEIFATFLILILGWLFVPVYMSAEIYTMPEYLRERFGGQRIRVCLSVLSLVTYILTKISADLYAGALFLQLVLNKTSWEWLYISILILLGFAAVFTIAGGLTAVIWTDFVQSILMLIGAFFLMVFAFIEVGGYHKMVEDYPYAVPSKQAGNGSCGIPPDNYMSLLRSPYPSESDLPWTGMTFGLLIIGTYYFSTEQVMVQRMLSSKNMIHAKAGCVFAAYLKLLPLWLMVFPGMIARILFPDTVGCSDPEECQKVCGNERGCSNIAYPELVIKLLPTGLKGLMVAVMMASLMSSLTSVFNSASTIFTIDVWSRFRKRPSDLELVIVGRIFVLFLVAISIIWVPVIQNSGNTRLFDYVNSVLSFLAPPVCAVFIMAIFWHRATENGAFWALIIGLLVGFLRFILEFSMTPPICGEENESVRNMFFVLAVEKIHYLHFAIILFTLTILICFVVSLMTKPIPEDRLHRLTFWTRKSPLVRNKEKFIENNYEQKEKGETNLMINEDRTQEVSEPSKCTRIIFRIFGSDFGKKKGDGTCEEITKVDLEEKAKRAAEFLQEPSNQKMWVNFFAVIVMCVTAFIYGFYS